MTASIGMKRSIESGLDALVYACFPTETVQKPLIIQQTTIVNQKDINNQVDVHVQKRNRITIDNLAGLSSPLVAADGSVDDGYVSDNSTPSIISGCLSDSDTSPPALEKSQGNDLSDPSQLNGQLCSSNSPAESAIVNINSAHAESLNDVMLAIKNANPRNFVSLNISYSKCAQKSYGSEKRFLCPPPVLRSTIDSNELRRNCTVSTVTCASEDEESSQIVDTEPYISHNGDALLYRHLYVSANSKVKSFKLMVEIKDKNITIETNDISMISKPSKKKVQKDGLLIRDGDLISLFNRINSQTVRTRYIHHARNDPYFTAQYNSWSPIRISVDHSRPHTIRDGFVRYGSVIILSDYLTNTTIERLVIRKVEKNQVMAVCSSPIGLMSRVCLMRESMPGVYLSTPVDSIAKRIAMNSMPLSSMDSESENCLMFGAASVNSEGFELIQDSMCWTLSAVDSISTTIMPLLQQPKNSIRKSVPFLTSRPTISHGNVLTIRGRFLDQVKQCIFSSPGQTATSSALMTPLETLSTKTCDDTGDILISYLLHESASFHNSNLYLICDGQEYAVCCPLW